MGSIDDLPISPKRQKQMIVLSVVSMILSFIASSVYFNVFFDIYHVGFFLVIVAKVTLSVDAIILCSKKEFLTRKNIHYSAQIMGSVGTTLYLFPAFRAFMNSSSYTQEEKNKWVSWFCMITLTDAGLSISANIFSYLAIARFKSPPRSHPEIRDSPPLKAGYIENNPLAPISPAMVYQKKTTAVLTHGTGPLMPHGVPTVLTSTERVIYQPPPVQVAHGVHVNYVQPPSY